MSAPLPENEATFGAEELVRATGGRWLRKENSVVGVTTDSRRAEAGQLFVALTGARFDGHHYASAAVKRGAAVMVHRPIDLPPTASVLLVDDCLQALGSLARFHRRRFDIPVVAITGSVGKTSTKDMLSRALRAAGYRVHATRANFNNQVGVPLTVLGLSSEHAVAVVEMGMNEPGEIARLASIAEPTHGVVTSVAAAHAEGVGTLEDIAREKGALLMALSPEGHAIYNADDAPLRPYADGTAAKNRYSFGTHEGASVRVLDVQVTAEPSNVVTLALDGSERTLELQLLGRGAALNTAAVVAILRALLVSDPVRAVESLTTMEPTPGRFAPTEIEGGGLLIDDTYNASPRSTLVALETAAAIAKARSLRFVAVLGDMFELGDRSAEHHDTVVEACRNVDEVIFVGDDMGAAARRLGVGQVATGWQSAAQMVIASVGEPAVTLIKGSRGMRMERIVDAVLASRKAGGAA